MKQFHYIIAGAGCAGLSLLVRLLQSGRFSDKQILLVDKAPKTANDRTWCFWEKEEGYFEPVVSKQWDRLWIHNTAHSAVYDIAPYRYKMIRGDDFYRYCFDIIQQHANVTIHYGTIEKMFNTGEGAAVQVGGEMFCGEYVFNSVLSGRPPLQRHHYYLQQHFTGWIIETPEPVFDPAAATLMDFRMPQENGTTFGYVLPLSPSRALVEYTLFSEKLLEPADYENGLQSYLRQFLHIQDYKVLEEEFGIIPMTNYPFAPNNGAIINIGTAGGQTRASSGYTFRFIQKQARVISEALLKTGKPYISSRLYKKRFRFYDSVLLHILSRRKLAGSFIFTELFRKNNPVEVLQFLDNETSILQDLKIITVLPKGIFLKAAMTQLFTQ